MRNRHPLFGGFVLAQHDLEFQEMAEVLHAVQVDARLPGVENNAVFSHAPAFSVSGGEHLA